MATEPIGLELGLPTGERVRVIWPPDALAAPRFPEASGWRLDGDLDWNEVEALRIVAAALPDGRALALASLRPVDAAGHGDDEIAAALVADGSAEPVLDPLLSVEYAEGMPRRLGLELYGGGNAMPLRIAADVTDVSTAAEQGLTHLRATLEVRLDGKRAAGSYEILTRR